jgi:ubiquinone/menaquinone biosynthesis C-methylase UbiE
MSGLEFTDEAAKQLEKLYLTTDVAAQRLETIRHLNLSTGESVLDVGCGPGFLCENMAEIVGRGGTVVVCTQVAEYVADVDRVLSEAFRVLKPNGRTVLLQRIGTH